MARLRALATLAASPPASSSPRSSIKWVTFVVITAVVGLFFSEICTSAFCTAIAATPDIPAMIASVAFVSLHGPAVTPSTRKVSRNISCSNSSDRKVETPDHSRPLASRRVKSSTSMKTGTDRKKKKILKGRLHHAQAVGFSTNFGHLAAPQKPYYLQWVGLPAARASGSTESERTPCAP